MIENWRNAWKFHSVWVAVFWTAVSALYMALPAFAGMISPFAFAGLCVFMGLLLLFARLTKQPGVADD